MKKIVWVFGESATGKLTLINNLCNNDKDTLDTFNMNNKKICVSEITLEDRDHENYVDVIQIEINGKYRDYNNIKKLENLIQSLQNFVKQYNEYIKR